MGDASKRWRRLRDNVGSDHGGNSGASEKLGDPGNISKFRPTVHAEMREV